MKLEELKKQKVDIENKIKKIERQKAQRGLFKEAKKTIGKCYRFRNKYVNETDYWYIYAEVKGAIIEGSSVYMILDKYEITKNNEIKISLNIRELEAVRPMHCWDSINLELFKSEKEKVINLIPKNK